MKAHFAERLKKLMETTGTTQTALAKAIGMTRQGVASYISERTMPDIETFAKIANFFGVSFDYLLGNTEEKPLLLPCPFCGLPGYITDGGYSGEKWYVCCISGRADNNYPECPAAEGMTYKTKEEAVKRWNTRS